MLPLITSLTLHIQICPAALKCPHAKKKKKKWKEATTAICTIIKVKAFIVKYRFLSLILKL